MEGKKSIYLSGMIPSEDVEFQRKCLGIARMKKKYDDKGNAEDKRVEDKALHKGEKQTKGILRKRVLHSDQIKDLKSQLHVRVEDML